MEWTASDGRKGRLTGTGKPRLTAASLAKVPSEISPPKALPVAKSTSKRAASVKPAADENNLGGGNPWDYPVAKSESNKSSPGKSPSNKYNGWGPQNTSNGNSDPLASPWENNGDAPGGDGKNEGTNNPTPDAKPAASEPAEATSGSNALATTANEDEQHEDKNPHVFTKDEDDKMLKWKAENGTKPWADFAQEIGKQGPQCKERYGQIKPKDPDTNAGKQGGGKKGKKDKNFKHDQNQGEKKKDDNKTSGKTGNTKNEKKAENDSCDIWGGIGGDFMIDTNDDKKDDAAKNNDTAGGVDNQTWPIPSNPTLKPPTNKTSAQARFQPNASNNNTQSITGRPLALEVKPDDTFSADDLRLVARILQQDCSMVWNRVSWRFRDKTGRTLHPDEFEKKITGRLEGKGSEKGERRR
jgi:hypothetical protein